MAAITSNGTGGGDYSVGASWNGGVAPGLGDTAQVVAGDTITIDATFQVGDDTATPALDVLNGAFLDWDNLGNDTCDFQGDFYVRNGGTLTLNGAAAGGNKLIIQLNRSAALAAGKYGFITEDGAIIAGTGFDKTRSWDTLSADAAAGQANVVTTNDNSVVWAAGDEFVVGSMSTRTKTGAEADTIGAFGGGNVITKAGANYASIHEQNVAFINLTRNVVFTSFNVGFKGYVFITNSTDTNVTFDWCEFSYLGSSALNKYGVCVFDADFATFNYCSFHRCYTGLRCAIAVLTILTIDNCVFGLNIFADVDLIGAASVLTNSAALGNDRVGIGTSIYCDITGCHAANSDGDGIKLAALLTVIAVDDCRCYGNNADGIEFGGLGDANSCLLDGNGVGVRFKQAISRLRGTSFGAQVANTTDIISPTIVVGTGINTTVLNVTVTGTPDNRVSIEDTGNDHKTWKVAGSYEKQAVVVRTGVNAMLLSPISATDPLIAESTVPASTGIQIVVSCYLRKNVAYGAANRPFLRLSGKGMVTDTATMTDVDNTWELVVVSGTPTSDGFAKVEFVVQSAGGGAAAYVDDVLMVYTAIDTGGMDFWYEGGPPTTLMSTGLGATDVWAAPTRTLTALGFQLATADFVAAFLTAALIATDAIGADELATSAVNEIRDAILADSTPFNGADIAAILTDTAVMEPLVSVFLDAAISSRATPADVTGAHVVTDALINAVHAVTDALIGTRATPADVAGAHAVTDALVGTRATPIDVTGAHAVTDALITAAHAATDALVIARATPADIAAAHAVTDALIAALNDPTVAQIVASIFARIMEGALTFEEYLRIMYAQAANPSAGGGTAVNRFRDLADAKDRILANVDVNGNRTAVVVDGT